MHEWASTHIPGVVFFFVSANDVSENAAKNDLPSRFASAQTISGTHLHHCFLPVYEAELQMKRISAGTDFTVVSSGTPSAANQIPLDHLQPGQYIACMYDRQWYISCITEHSEEHSDILVNFTKHSSTGLLSWPSASRQDKCWVPYQHIICLASASELQGHSARFYKLKLEDQMQVHAKLS